MSTGVALRASRPSRCQRGMVTAELATIAPLGVALAVLLLWIVSLGITQVRLVDSSREAARMVARGESVDSAEAVARRLAPPGARIDVTERKGLVEVRVGARSRVPVPLFENVGARSLSATAVAASEKP